MIDVSTILPIVVFIGVFLAVTLLMGNWIGGLMAAAAAVVIMVFLWMPGQPRGPVVVGPGPAPTAVVSGPVQSAPGQPAPPIQNDPRYVPTTNAGALAAAFPGTRADLWTEFSNETPHPWVYNGPDCRSDRRVISGTVPQGFIVDDPSGHGKQAGQRFEGCAFTVRPK